MIVKVQVSVSDSLGRKMMLIYDKERTLIYEAELTPEVEKAMDGSLKRYFNAELVDTKIQLESVVEKWPRW